MERINIQHGIENGNRVLKTVADRLQSIEGYNIYRSMGNRFILSGIKGCIPGRKESINRIIHELISPPIAVGELIVEVQYKGAKVLYPSQIRDRRLIGSNLLLALLDKEKIMVNEIIDVSTELSESAFRTYRLSELLSRDVKEDRLRTVIQPKVDLKSGRIAGGELLQRWESKEFGSVSPSEFIPIAEQHDLIIPLTEKVIRDAAYLKTLTEELPREERISVAINISPMIVQSRRVADMVDLSMKLSESMDLEFELTEGAFLGTDESLRRELESVHRHDIRISIDDFGTGYSNFEYLQDIKIDVIKVDRKFVTELPHDERQLSLVSAIITMGKALGLKVIVEGVERKEQYDWLVEQGADEVQGYYFAKPMSLDAFAEFYKAHDPDLWRV